MVPSRPGSSPPLILVQLSPEKRLCGRVRGVAPAPQLAVVQPVPGRSIHRDLPSAQCGAAASGDRIGRGPARVGQWANGGNKGEAGREAGHCL